MGAFMRRVFLATAVLVAGALAVAPGFAATTNAPKQAAPKVEVSPDPLELVVVAMRIAAALEQGQAPAIWDNASPVMKTISSKDQFNATSRQRQAINGPLKNLTWRSIMRIQMAQQQGQLPAGQYLTVNLVGLNNDNKAVVETVSFVLDGDQRWRLVGFTE
jgi:hypothetical protein